MSDPDLRARAAGAGDDYEVAFTIPLKRLTALKLVARASRIPVTIIGHMEKGQGVAVRLADGTFAEAEAGGYDHFAR